MKSGDLKKVLKPLIKQCIKEVILEEGILSGIVSEVVTGLGSPVIKESARAVPVKAERIINNNLSAEKKKLIDSIGADAFNGVNIFEGVTPAPAQKSKTQVAADPLADTDPSDPGVDISGILSVGGKNWKALI
tara:strand:+ start:1163 stop:1561 length:399 start_codon:yes stop_codon:yes gene_type:complete